MKLIMMGDSTMKKNNASTYPQIGWGQMLESFFDDQVRICNFAENGRSTRTFIDLGNYQKALECASVGDYCVIQFAHNDEKENSERFTDPFTTYRDNLRRFINEFRNKGVEPILVTSVYRRFFIDGVIDDSVHKNYREAMKIVANEENVPVIDMCKLSKEFISQLGEQASERLFMIFPANMYDNYPEGMYDNTHLRADGAYEMAKIFASELLRLGHPLANNLIKKEIV